MPRNARHGDPMRELDLIVLEDLMMRRTFEPTRTGMALQTAGMLLVLAGVITVFVFALLPTAGDATTEHQNAPSSEVSLMLPVP